MRIRYLSNAAGAASGVAEGLDHAVVVFVDGVDDAVTKATQETLEVPMKHPGHLLHRTES
jgi:hypothetical protein